MDLAPPLAQHPVLKQTNLEKFMIFFKTYGLNFSNSAFKF